MSVDKTLVNVKRYITFGKFIDTNILSKIIAAYQLTHRCSVDCLDYNCSPFAIKLTYRLILNRVQYTKRAEKIDPTFIFIQVNESCQKTTQRHKS